MEIQYYFEKKTSVAINVPTSGWGGGVHLNVAFLLRPEEKKRFCSYSVLVFRTPALTEEFIKTH